MNKARRITNFYVPNGDKFASCHGFVNWKEWLKEEIAHGKKIGRKMIIVKEINKKKETGRVALARTS